MTNTAPNRVMRFKNNPNARGFIVYVLEEVSGTRNDALGYVEFRTIASETAGTKKKCDAVYARMKAEYNAR